MKLKTLKIFAVGLPLIFQIQTIQVLYTAKFSCHKLLNWQSRSLYLHLHHYIFLVVGLGVGGGGAVGRGTGFPFRTLPNI